MRHIIVATALAAGCVVPEGTVASFVEDFVDNRWIDEVGTNAELDLDQGVVRGVSWELGHPGDGSDGALVTTKKTTLAPGEYQFKSVTLRHPVAVDGDLTLRVAGPLVTSEAGELEVSGTLTLIAGGPIELGASVRARDDLVIEQPSEAGIVIEQGSYVGTQLGNHPAPGHVRVSTRGGLSVLDASYLQTGAPKDGEAPPDLTIRAGGDITIANTSFVRPTTRSGAAGRTHVTTEGSLLIEERSFLGTHEAGGTLEVHALGDMRLTGSCFAEAGAGGSIDLRVAGTLSLDSSSFVTCRDGSVGPCDVAVAARRVDLTARSWLEAGGSSRDRGGNLSITVAEDLSITDHSWAVSGDGYCVDAGFFEVRVGGDIVVLDRSRLRAASSLAHGEEEDCLEGATEPQRDGDLTIEAGGTFTDDKTAGVYDLNGASTGDVTLVEGADPLVTVAPQVGRSSWVRSLAIPLEGGAATVLDAVVITQIADGETIQVEVSPDGSDAAFVAMERLIGVTLMDGWRYRAELTARLFDGPTLDRIQVDHASP